MKDERQGVASLLAALHQRPEERAFSLGGEDLSWGELERRSRAYAAWLRARGFGRGERIAVWGETSLEYVIALVGHHRAGVVHVPLNTRYRARELAHVLDDSGARAVFGPADVAVLDEVLAGRDVERVLPDLTRRAPAAGELGEPDVLPRDEDIALLLYTSGTTGRSKGVQLSFRAIAAGIGALTRLWRFSAEDRLALALPIFHVHGLCIGIHGTLIGGLHTLLIPRFSPEAVVSAFRDEGATVFMGVPTMYARLLAHLRASPDAAAPLAAARLFTSGSAALPADDFRTFEALTGHRIVERYGMTETMLTISNPYAGERRPGSVGMPVPGCEVRITGEPGEPGELAIRGDFLMSGYLNLPEATREAYEDGWFMTGDVAVSDADGYIRIVGRKSVDIIKSGGFKLSAREIEEVLLAHPAVAEAAVVGLPDEEWGQQVAAAVVPAGGAGSDPKGLAEALGTYCAAELAGFKKPRAWCFPAALPRNAMGKLQKHEIVARWPLGRE